MPPDSVLGRASAKPARPDARDLGRGPPLALCLGRWRGRPNATLSLTLSHGISRGSWNTMPTLGEGPVKGVPSNEMRPWVGGVEPGHQAQQRALAAAAGADHGQDLAFGNAEA